jgi:hypothetical protein
MTIEATEVTTQIVDTAAPEDRFEVETNIVAEPEKETAAEEVQAEPTPIEESQEKKSINPRTLARKAEKERLIRENATMAEKLRQFESAKPPVTEPKVRDTSEEPNIQDYDDVLEYNRDIAKYDAVQAFKQETSRLNTEKRIESFRERAESVRAEKPDFDERLQSLNTSGLITPELDEAIMSSNMSPEVAYHLSQYSDDLMTLRGLPKDMLPKAMKAIEAFIKQGGEKQEQPRVTKAQPPITPPGMSVKTDRSINSYSQEEIENMPLSEFNKRFK